MIQQLSQNAPLTNTLVLSVSGADANKFLQGQLTCDVNALESAVPQIGAYCNIKGRVESLFKICKQADGYQLKMHPEILQGTLAELKKYAVFSKVDLVLQEAEWQVENELLDIRAKIPELYPQTVGMFFAHDLNLPELNAVSFTKGCYRGQEIVARMQHRGNLKRRLHIFTSTSTKLQPGANIVNADGISAGTVVRYCTDADSYIGLAVITDTMLAQPLQLENDSIRLHIQDNELT